MQSTPRSCAVPCPSCAAWFQALLKLWPDLVSYAVSYAFIAVVWLNHHAVLRHAQRLTGTLALANFANLTNSTSQAHAAARATRSGESHIPWA